MNPRAIIVCGLLNRAAFGLCECGCGGSVTISKSNDYRLGHVKDRPIRFITGHNLRSLWGKNHWKWRNNRADVGRSKNGHYEAVKMLGHPRANSRGYVREHILIAEKALGKPLPQVSRGSPCGRDT